MGSGTKRLLAHALLFTGCGEQGFQSLDPSPTDSLSGRILLDGRPVPGASVHLVENGVSVSKVQSDSAGRFRFVPLPLIGPTTLVAHDERAHAAVEEIQAYPGGSNDVGPISLRPITGFPALLTFRGLGLDERLTDAPGDLAVRSVDARGSGGRRSNDRIMFDITPRGHPAPETIIELSLVNGELRTVVDPAPPGLVWFTAQFYLQRQGLVNQWFREFVFFERASGTEIARFVPAQGDGPAFEDAASTLWFEATKYDVDVEEISALVLSAVDGVARGTPFPADSAGVVGSDAGAFYQVVRAPVDLNDPSSDFLFRPRRLHRLDRASLASEPIGPLLNPTHGGVPFAEFDPESRAVILIRGVGDPGICALSELSVDTGELRDRFVLDAGIESCQDMAMGRHGRLVLLRGRPIDEAVSSYFLADLDRETPLQRLASGEARVCFNGGAILGFCSAARLAVFSFETSTWTEFDPVIRIDAQDVDVCQEWCRMNVLDDGTVVLISGLNPGGSAAGALLEILPGGERRVRGFGAPPDAAVGSSPDYPTRIHRSIEVAPYQRDAKGRRQLLVAPRGTSFQDFSPATFFSLEELTYLGSSADERWLYYLARDPLSGLRQLFRTSSDRSRT